MMVTNYRIGMQQESYTTRSDPPSRQLLMLTEGFEKYFITVIILPLTCLPTRVEAPGRRGK